MSPDTEKKMTRRRAGIALATVGACAAGSIGIVAAQSSNQPAATTVSEQAITPGGIAPGERVPAEKALPKVLRDALAKQRGPVVAGFVLPGVNEDERVTEWLKTIRKDPKFSDTTVLIYRITPQSRLQDIPEILDISSTPVVAVFQKDGKIAATWRGIVDSEIVAQSVIDARRNIQRPVSLAPSTGGPHGNSAGIKLAKRVNAHYVKQPLVVEKVTGIDRFPYNQLTAAVSSESTHVLRKGKVVGVYQTGIAADGEKFEMVLNRKGAFLKRPSMSCWIQSTPKSLGDLINQPLLPLQALRFGKPFKAKKVAGQVKMKIWDVGKSQPAWVARIDVKTAAIVSLKRDRLTSTIGASGDPGSGTVASVKPAKKGAKGTTGGANPMATWPSTTPTCPDVG